jgi:hypothetical protein
MTAATTPGILVLTPLPTPVPTLALPTPRAIRVQRSPR